MDKDKPKGWKNKFTEPKPYDPSIRWRSSPEESKASHEQWVNLDPDTQQKLNKMGRFTITQVSLLDALEIFGEDANPVHTKKLEDLKEQESKLRDLLEAKVGASQRVHHSLKAFDRWFLTQVLTIKTATRLTEIKKERKRIAQALGLTNSKGSEKWAEKVERAKQVPIEDLYPGKLKKVGKKLKGLCVLHQEKNPSLFISQAHNKFKCYGCQESGDSIAFLMKKDIIDFKAAVRRLAP